MPYKHLILTAGYEPALGFTFSLPFIIIPHNTTQIVTLTSTSRNTVQILFPHIMWSAQAVHDSKNRPHLTQSICFARNPKHVIVQWVGIRTDRQTSHTN